MSLEKLKKIGSIVLILLGAIALLIELGASTKNYYIQSFGILCLMSGLFMVNMTLSSRSTEEQDTISKIEEEE